MADSEGYEGREQSRVKHFILERYLERFAHIIGSKWTTISYIDCFSGPWQSWRPDLSDTSFAIALRELRKAKHTHAARGRHIDIRCLFLEEDVTRHANLKAYVDRQKDVTVETRNLPLLCAIPEIDGFLAGAPDSFPFVFIDPTGWTGFDMNVIGPLLRHRPSEVLINFMTNDIRRFTTGKETRPDIIASFRRLFGTDEVFQRVSKLTDPVEREDALFTAYAACLQAGGDYGYVCPSVVLHPLADRTYFHLIYATRSRRGVEVFRDVEKQAFNFQDGVRAEAAEQRSVRLSGQPSLFASDTPPASRHAVALRERYLAAARTDVEKMLIAQRQVSFDLVWDAALAYPLVWDSDVKDWVRVWQGSGQLHVAGMRPKQKVPQYEEDHILEWLPG